MGIEAKNALASLGITRTAASGIAALGSLGVEIASRIIVSQDGEKVGVKKKTDVASVDLPALALAGTQAPAEDPEKVQEAVEQLRREHEPGAPAPSTIKPVL
jgi:hypothetical protein